MTADKSKKRLKVAIIGGGPGGLGAAIELAKLPFVNWELYEKKPQISEMGGGISLQPNTWRLLEYNGTAENINAKDFYRPADGQIEQRRWVFHILLFCFWPPGPFTYLVFDSNGRNGKLLIKKYNSDDINPHRQSSHLVRAKLQAALLKNVDKTHVNVAKKLVGVEHLPDNQVRISFEDGFMDEVDLLVGADGIRSVGRARFPRMMRRKD
jgi:salicylate hydroxylase